MGVLGIIISPPTSSGGLLRVLMVLGRTSVFSTISFVETFEDIEATMVLGTRFIIEDVENRVDSAGC